MKKFNCKSCKTHQDVGSKPRILIQYGEPLVWFNAKFKKPEEYKTVLVADGCVFWNGENWVTRMYDQRIIEWKVEWWAELPKSPE